MTICFSLALELFLKLFRFAENFFRAGKAATFGALMGSNLGKFLSVSFFATELIFFLLAKCFHGIARPKTMEPNLS
jgi:uncharacterized protein YqgC (DUF456 family)